MSTVSGELNSMSAWVTFKDTCDVTHVVLREHVHRSPYATHEVLIDEGGLQRLIQTQLPYDEIMSD